MLPSNLWLGRHVCLMITGASRGFGRQIALSLAKNFVDYHNQRCQESPANCDTDYSLSFVLMARNAAALQGLSHELSAIHDRHIHVVDIICGSLDDPITVESFDRTCQAIDSGCGRPYDQLIVVHNAGTLGDVNQRTSDYGPDSRLKIVNYLDVNLVSVMQMMGIFLGHFQAVEHRLAINISSLCALKAFDGLSLYCIGKAARDAFFRSVALENPTVQVLNYSPGPLETDMVDTLRNEGYLCDIYKQMDILKPEQSANRLIEILEQNDYTSGDHVDYYPPTPPPPPTTAKSTAV